MNWYPPCWEVTKPDRMAVTITRGRLWTPIEKSWCRMARVETFPDTTAPTVRQARSPMAPACAAIAAPILPTIRNGPFIARSMKS